ncbi:MAG: lipocalin family protein [Bacteroidales bacterium]|nr:lipocalin family protein [Bacteroidales bacterium]
MKKLFFAVAALATLLTVSCTKEQTTDDKLQGTWEINDASCKVLIEGKEVDLAALAALAGEDFPDLNKVSEQIKGATVTFNKGTVTIKADGRDDMEANYAINGSVLTLTPKDQDSKVQNIEFTIAEITATNLTLTTDVLKMIPNTKDATEMPSNISVPLTLKLIKK